MIFEQFYRCTKIKCITCRSQCVYKLNFVVILSSSSSRRQLFKYKIIIIILGQVVGRRGVGTGVVRVSRVRRVGVGIGRVGRAGVGNCWGGKCTVSHRRRVSSTNQQPSLVPGHLLLIGDFRLDRLNRVHQWLGVCRGESKNRHQNENL